MLITENIIVVNIADVEDMKHIVVFMTRCISRRYDWNQGAMYPTSPGETSNTRHGVSLVASQVSNRVLFTKFLQTLHWLAFIAQTVYCTVHNCTNFQLYRLSVRRTDVHWQTIYCTDCSLHWCHDLLYRRFKHPTFLYWSAVTLH